MKQSCRRWCQPAAATMRLPRLQRRRCNLALSHKCWLLPCCAANRQSMLPRLVPILLCSCSVCFTPLLIRANKTAFVAGQAGSLRSLGKPAVFTCRCSKQTKFKSSCGAQMSVRGMHCSACSSAVESALAALPGVSSASVALLAQSAEVRLCRQCRPLHGSASLCLAVVGLCFCLKSSPVRRKAAPIKQTTWYAWSRPLWCCRLSTTPVRSR